MRSQCNKDNQALDNFSILFSALLSRKWSTIFLGLFVFFVGLTGGVLKQNHVWLKLYPSSSLARFAESPVWETCWLNIVAHTRCMKNGCRRTLPRFSCVKLCMYLKFSSQVCFFLWYPGQFASMNPWPSHTPGRPAGLWPLNHTKQTSVCQSVPVTGVFEVQMNLTFMRSWFCLFSGCCFLLFKMFYGQLQLIIKN